MFSRMSSRRRSGLSEGKSALALYGATQPLLTDRLGDDIHRMTENVGQAPGQGIDAAEIGESTPRRLLIEAHHHVDIRIVRVIAARHRSENRQAGHPSGLKLGFMRTQ